MLKLFLSSYFGVPTRKLVVFVTLPRNNVLKSATAFMKESNQSMTYILEVDWGAVLKKLRL